MMHTLNNGAINNGAQNQGRNSEKFTNKMKITAATNCEIAATAENKKKFASTIC